MKLYYHSTLYNIYCSMFKTAISFKFKLLTAPSFCQRGKRAYWLSKNAFLSKQRVKKLESFYRCLQHMHSPPNKETHLLLLEKQPFQLKQTNIPAAQRTTPLPLQLAMFHKDSCMRFELGTLTVFLDIL